MIKYKAFREIFLHTFEEILNCLIEHANAEVEVIKIFDEPRDAAGNIIVTALIKIYYDSFLYDIKPILNPSNY